MTSAAGRLDRVSNDQISNDGPPPRSRRDDLLQPAYPLVWARNGAVATREQLDRPVTGVRTPRRPLIGRRRERAVLDEVVSAVQGGNSRALVIRGEAGVGKTALLEYLASHARNCRVVSADGDETEMELPFAGLQQLCLSLLDDLDELPTAQRDALRTAFGLAGGDPPDRFLVSVAVLALLVRASRRRPLMCVVDDVDWLDLASQQVLAFVARRLGDEAIAIVATSRIPRAESRVRDLPELPIDGLPDADARALLESALTGPMDEVTRTTFIAETRGNPLAILELPRGLTPEQLAGGFGNAGDLTGWIEGSFRRRIQSYPRETLLLLLVAAADPGNDPVLIWRVADQLGIGARHAGPAIADGYVEFNGQVRFCHPIARSTVYRSATPDDRHTVHSLFARALDPAVDPDRRAWHRAHATHSLDEEVAGELASSAARAQARGGIAAAAAFLERAAELTPDPVRRTQRALTAAEAKFQAGSPERALRLLAITEAGPHDELTGAHAELLRARIAITSGDRWEGPLLRASERLETLDHESARGSYRDAFFAALTAGRLATHGGVREVARATLATTTTRSQSSAHDLLLNGLATLVKDGYRAGAPRLRDALNDLRRADLSTDAVLQWFPLACRVAHSLWDEVTYEELSERLLQAARERGDMSVLPLALSLRVGSAMFVGEIDRAALLADECDAVARATEGLVRPYVATWLAAWRGDESTTANLIASANEDMVARHEGQWIPAAAWALALLRNALGYYEAALTSAEKGSEYPDELGLATSCLVELVEAAVRSGSPERAVGAMQRLSEIAASCRTEWVLGVHARLSAMLDQDASAEASYREAIARLERTRVRTELARAHLVYGEWLRRENRRIHAREQLRTALEMFSDMKLDGFSGRARRELLATGETVRKRTVETVNDLTAQEAQIARLAVYGHTNSEIGGQLFISPRTVEWHLRKVFAKLGVRSRKELPMALREIESKI